MFVFTWCENPVSGTEAGRQKEKERPCLLFCFSLYFSSSSTTFSLSSLTQTEISFSVHLKNVATASTSRGRFEQSA